MRQYCGNRSQQHPYPPRWLPDGLGLLRHPPRLVKPLPLLLPVLREEDYEEQKFYYYAAGCSDLYIRVGQHIVANNRIRALVQLVAASRAPRVLEKYCGPQLIRANHTAQDVLDALINEGGGYSVSLRILEVSGSGCLNVYLAQSMRTRGINTLLLNDEPPGLFTRWSRRDERKVEIMHLEPHALYGEDGNVCESAGVGCLHCRNGTPRARFACRGWMRHHGHDAKDWRSVTPEWQAEHSVSKAKAHAPLPGLTGGTMATAGGRSRARAQSRPRPVVELGDGVSSSMLSAANTI
jgi:hypothetical protein